MRGISEEKLRKFQQSMFAREAGREAELRLLTLLINECQELNPWLTLEEFLKSEFEGLCWIEFPSEIITAAYFDGHLFKHSSTSDFVHDENYITRVQPIHKPEPPR